MIEPSRIRSLIFFCLLSLAAFSQGSDSLIVQQMREEGVKFSHNNSVVLLTTGQEKFDDMFAAIDRARSSVHLEYFNLGTIPLLIVFSTFLQRKQAKG